MSDELNGNRDSVSFCDADACSSCGLAEGAPDCLRRKADFCLSLANRFGRTDLGIALHKLSMHLAKDADALEEEAAALSGCGRATAS